MTWYLDNCSWKLKAIYLSSSHICLHMHHIFLQKRFRWLCFFVRKEKCEWNHVKVFFYSHKSCFSRLELGLLVSSWTSTYTQKHTIWKLKSLAVRYTEGRMLHKMIETLSVSPSLSCWKRIENPQPLHSALWWFLLLDLRALQLESFVLQRCFLRCVNRCSSDEKRR